jgi:hypothetical protein
MPAACVPASRNILQEIGLELRRKMFKPSECFSCSQMMERNSKTKLMPPPVMTCSDEEGSVEEEFRAKSERIGGAARTESSQEEK